MTTTEVIVRSECDDLRREVAALRRDLDARNAQVHRLNALLVRYEAQIVAQEGVIEELKQDLSDARAETDHVGTLLDAQELPY